MTLVRYRAWDARSQTCWSMDFPPIETRAFPGNRDEAYRAGITPRMRSGTLDSSKLGGGLGGSLRGAWIEDLNLAEAGKVTGVERQYPIYPVHVHGRYESGIVSILS